LEEVSSVVSFEKLLLQLTHLGKWGGGVFWWGNYFLVVGFVHLGNSPPLCKQLENKCAPYS
jgi:hypothetical protein